MMLHVYLRELDLHIDNISDTYDNISVRQSEGVGLTQENLPSCSCSSPIFKSVNGGPHPSVEDRRATVLELGLIQEGPFYFKSSHDLYAPHPCGICFNV